MAKYVVTGGGGFVGGALCAELRRRGAEVVSLARGDYPELRAQGVRCERVDLGDSNHDLSSILDGADAIFHTAAKVEMWGPFDQFYRANVLGTRNVLKAARAAGVRKFIFTSSPSVVAGPGDLEGVDESCPYPARHLAHYPSTKAIAEREVLAESDESLFTISLRPHLIFGPGDHNFIPTILSRARSGRLVRVGDGSNKTDLCFIDDCVSAHLLANDALDRNSAARGRAYFITQGQPVNMWGWIDRVLQRNGIAPVAKSIPASLATGLAYCFELLARVRGSESVPLLTRFLVHEMCSNHYFNIEAAKRDLGFVPRYSIDDAMDRTFGKS